ncbi:MAG: RsmE family RNA methyltransferase, partial [Treponema sp.]|nr:RsmE family RNA methyltransferase [Treponema sp.]
TKLFTDGGAHAALVEGAVQARDTRIPTLSVYSCLEDWLAARPWDRPPPHESPTLPGKFASQRWSAYAAGSLGRSPLLIALDNVRPEGSVALLSALGQHIVMAVGCERGWSDRERGELEKSGFIRLSMGERALRTETACTAAAVLALEKIGAFG